MKCEYCNREKDRVVNGYAVCTECYDKIQQGINEPIKYYYALLMINHESNKIIICPRIFYSEIQAIHHFNSYYKDYNTFIEIVQVKL